MENTNLISVILPVYNGGEYLEEAIESILGQTYSDFELIIINDGSKDHSASIVSKFKDKRIRYYEKENQGLAKTLNRAIDLAKGNYIARHDQDDISLPERFEKQKKFLEKNREIALVGTFADIISGREKTTRIYTNPTEDLPIKFHLLFDNPFVHSSVMFRKSVVEEMGGYSIDPGLQPPEDYELWQRISRKYKMANIPESLLIYREVPNSMSRVSENPFLDNVIRISSGNISYLLNSSDSAIDDLSSIVHKAMHKLSPEADFRKITFIVNQIAEEFYSRSEDKTFIREKINSLMYQVCERYVNYKQEKYQKRFGKLAVLLGLAEKAYYKLFVYKKHK